MHPCEKDEHCDFFKNRISEPKALLAVLKRNFCLSNKNHCARYKVYAMLRKGYAPEDNDGAQLIAKEMKGMFPDDQEKAHRVMEWLDHRNLT